MGRKYCNILFQDIPVCIYHLCMGRNQRSIFYLDTGLYKEGHYTGRMCRSILRNCNHQLDYRTGGSLHIHLYNRRTVLRIREVHCTGRNHRSRLYRICFYNHHLSVRERTGRNQRSKPYLDIVVCISRLCMGRMYRNTLYHIYLYNHLQEVQYRKHCNHRSKPYPDIPVYKLGRCKGHM